MAGNQSKRSQETGSLMSTNRQDVTADEQVRRIIAGSSGRPAIRCLADKSAPLTPADKSVIFLEAARVIQSDIGGVNLRNLTSLRKRRRLNLTR